MICLSAQAPTAFTSLLLMSDSELDFEAFWTSAKHGSLPPSEQAKVWAINWAMEKYGFKLKQDDICKAVVKDGGGHPTQGAISHLLIRIRSDAEWYPGKNNEQSAKRGPKITFTEQRRQAVANAAMALKRQGEEPSAANVRVKCPQATLNPNTGESYTDKYILEVFGSKCFDDDADEPWEQRSP